MSFGQLWSYNWAILGLWVFLDWDFWVGFSVFWFNNCSVFVVNAVVGDAGIGKGVCSLCLLGGVERGRKTTLPFRKLVLLSATSWPFELDFEAFLRRNYPTRYNNANLP